MRIEGQIIQFNRFEAWASGYSREEFLGSVSLQDLAFKEAHERNFLKRFLLRNMEVDLRLNGNFDKH